MISIHISARTNQKPYSATLIQLDGAWLEVQSPQAFAPGCPCELHVPMDNETHKIQGRVIGSKKNELGTFDVRLRHVSLTKSERQWLKNHFSSGF